MGQHPVLRTPGLDGPACGGSVELHIARPEEGTGSTDNDAHEPGGTARLRRHVGANGQEERHDRQESLQSLLRGGVHML